MVVIGFIEAFENVGFVAVAFGVINGTLQREIAVNLSFAGASAMGELTLLLTTPLFTINFYSWRGFPS